MTTRISVSLILAATLFALLPSSPPAPACCPAPPSGKPVVNADQTVIIIWDAATKTQHFIRQASFKSEADDFGFLVPTPTQPELDESGDDAFPYLRKLTEPETQKVARPRGNPGCGCSSQQRPMAAKDEVRVLDEKLVAGFQAVVLEADSAGALVGWLKRHGYAFSPAIEAWAKPYVEGGWKITALKVAKPTDNEPSKAVAASSLRLSFKTDRPLFPYREPDPQKDASALGARQRLLRVYFLADSRHRGELTADRPWTGKIAWAGELPAEHRAKVLDLLKLPPTTGPQQWFLTEFEDVWPYRPAPADVSFVRDAVQTPVKRPPIIQYVAIPLPLDASAYALAAVVVGPSLWRWLRRGTGPCPKS